MVLARLTTLFDALAVRGDVLSVDRAATMLAVSRRTVHSDVERLSAILTRNGHPSVAIERGQLRHPGGVVGPLARMLSINDIAFLDPGTRRRWLLEEVLSQRDGFLLGDLQDVLPVSRNTILRDLHDVRAILNDHGIALDSQPFLGHRVDADEARVRAVLAQAMAEDRSAGLFGLRHRGALLDAVQIFLDGVQQELRASFSDPARDALTEALMAAAQRVRHGHVLDIAADQGRPVAEERAVMAQSSTLREILGDGVPDVEVRDLAQRLRRASAALEPGRLQENWIRHDLALADFIAAVGIAAGEPGFAHDPELLRGLRQHFGPAYWRAHAGEQVINPTLGFVRGQLADLHAAVRRSVPQLQEDVGVSFDEGEIAYFTLFFAASRERARRRPAQPVRVVIVCREGLATSHFFRARLESLFDVDVAAVSAVHEVDKTVSKTHPELVLATIPLEMGALPVLQVSPWLDADDIGELSHHLPPRAPAVDLAGVMAVIRRHAHLSVESEQELARDLSQLLVTQPELPACELEELMLKEVLTPDLVLAQYRAVDRDDAVRQAGNLLVQAGLAKPQYVEAMLENIEVNGSYIVIAPGIAMPHARPERGALAVGLSLVTLAEPLAFGHPRNDPVDIVVALCATDDHTHLRALAELAELLGDADVVAQLREAGTPQDITTTLEGKTR